MMADQLAVALNNARLLRDLEKANHELVRTKTFESIATATGETSWGKIDPDQLPGTVICYTDSTIGLPLLTAYALAKKQPRARRRLYDRRGDLMTRFKKAYVEQGRASTSGAKG